MKVNLHKNDIPPSLKFGSRIAIDTETMGLKPERDRLCLVQLSAGDGNVHLVQFKDGVYNAPNLTALMTNQDIIKIFHFARFDLAVIKKHLGVTCTTVFCTKIASKLVRTYTEKHGLKDLCKELLNISISKEQQSSDWGAENLSTAQLNYAATDVLHLHALHDVLEKMLIREKRLDLANACFSFLPERVILDLKGWADTDIFSH